MTPTEIGKVAPFTPGRPVNGDVWITTKMKKMLFLDPEADPTTDCAKEIALVLAFGDFDVTGNPHDYDDHGDPMVGVPMGVLGLHSLLRRISAEKSVVNVAEYAVEWA